MLLAWSRQSYLRLAEIVYMCDGPVETAKCIWVSIWCMFDWNCRNTLLLYTAGQLVRNAKSDGALSDCESWDISGSWLRWCGLSVKRQLFCDLYDTTPSGPQNLYIIFRLLKNRILASWIQNRGIKCYATSVGVGTRNRFFLCMCSRNCIFIIVILMIKLEV